MRLLYRRGHYLEHPLEAIPAQIRWWWIGFRYGIRNIIRWFWIVWDDDDSDWTSLIEFMEHKLRWMGQLHRDHGHHTTSHVSARELLVAAELCKRIRTDDYYMRLPGFVLFESDYCPELGPWSRNHYSTGIDKKEHKCYDEYMMQQDIALLLKLMRKVRHWWA